ncbi:hypothetical protein BDAP_001749 [Binucleata daphniae]
MGENKIKLRFEGLHYLIPKEIFSEHIFNFKTDIFSFGLFIIELYFQTIQIPSVEADKVKTYEDLNLQKIRNEVRLEKHLIKDIILECIKENQGDRPDIDHLIEKLKAIKNALVRHNK